MKKIKWTHRSKRYDVNSSVVLMNDIVGVCEKACKICWDKMPETTIEGKLQYIKKRIDIGHESILEHSNIVMYFCIGNFAYNDLVEIMPLFKYLNVKTKIKEDTIYMLLGGSIRGYKHIFRNITNQNNYILREIRENLYFNTYKEFFSDFIEAGIMDENRFVIHNTEPEYDTIRIEPTTDKLTIVSADDFKCLTKIIKKYSDSESIDPFTTDDLLDMATVTILFKDMSRTATHQLVRHRNAITQESQRYVDYSKAKFASPDEFKDKYKDVKYNITLGDNTYNLTMPELGDMLKSVYPQLRDQDVLKEDARAFLPSNIECGKLYMTFTYRNLIKFLELRTDKAAQAEIREYAEIIYKEFGNAVFKNENMFKYLTPKYMLAENDYSYDGIDEVLEEFESEEEQDIQ